MSQVGGIVLCGGRSTRMGQPKAWLQVDRESMLARVVRTLAEVVEPVVVVAAPEQAIPDLPIGIQVVRDVQEGRGPMQGLATGLDALVGRVDAAFISGCDVPGLKASFIRRMIDLIGPALACVPWIEGFPHPLAAVYRLSVMKVVQEMLHAESLRLAGLLDRVPTRLVGENELRDIDPTLASLRNVNTPNEFAQFLRELQASSP
ncbi:MAG: molybdenum cofactor guanylyltransferase [Planctomycetes bacterium]|nr:molybdenum cofactor guanylyltransferase [Planctomycetota bacterium]